MRTNLTMRPLINEELLTQIDGAYGHLDETGPPINFGTLGKYGSK